MEINVARIKEIRATARRLENLLYEQARRARGSGAIRSTLDPDHPEAMTLTVAAAVQVLTHKVEELWALNRELAEKNIDYRLENHRLKQQALG